MSMRSDFSNTKFLSNSNLSNYHFEHSPMTTKFLYNSETPKSPKSSMKEKKKEKTKKEKNDNYSTITRTSNYLRYKTELCRSFEESGTCRFGEGCTFAHGFRELRAVPRHPRYKTEACRSYQTLGYCQYGTRCHFIHGVDDLQGCTLMQTPSLPLPGSDDINKEIFLFNIQGLYALMQGNGNVGQCSPEF